MWLGSCPAAGSCQAVCLNRAGNPAYLQKFAADAERVDVPPSLYFELRRSLPSPDHEMLKVCATINGQLAAA